MSKFTQTVGVRGRFSMVVLGSDGNVKQTVPLQDNLVLNNGLQDLLAQKCTSSNGKVEYASGGYFKCVVGGGAKSPEATDIKLEDFIAASDAEDEGFYPDLIVKDGNYRQVGTQHKYSFFTIKDKVIREVGLARMYNDGSYTLFTRAALLDTGGEAINLNIVAGDSLIVTYMLEYNIDTSRKYGTFTATIRNGKDSDEAVTATFDYFLQPYDVRNRKGITGASMYLNGGFSRMNSYGTVEGEQSSNYDLHDARFNELTDEDVSAIVRFTGSTDTVQNDALAADETSPLYRKIERVSEDTAKSTTWKVIQGRNTHNHKTGIIRAYDFGIGNILGDFFRCLVVVAEQGKGGGLPKDKSSWWEHTVTIKATRV